MTYLQTPEALQLIFVMPEYMSSASEALERFDVLEGSVQASMAADTFRRLADGAEPYDGTMAPTFELIWRQCQFAWEEASSATISFDVERIDAALPGMTQCSDGINGLTSMLDSLVS